MGANCYDVPLQICKWVMNVNRDYFFKEAVMCGNVNKEKERGTKRKQMRKGEDTE